MASLISDKSRWYEDGDGFFIAFRTKDRATAAQVSKQMDGKPWTVEAKPQPKKRSLDANAYAWVLIGKLSAILRITPEDVYRQYIPSIGGNYEVVPVKEDLIDRWGKLWCSGHIGRMTDDLGPCRNIHGYHNIRSYIGSSDYDTAQMSRLIELIVQDCKDQGIETMTPIELARLTEEWHG